MHVWFLQNFDTNAEHVFTDESLALRTAEMMVGNRSAGGDREIRLYGPGDGTTSVMVRRFTREDAEAMGLDVPPANQRPRFSGKGPYLSFEACEAAIRAERINVMLDEGRQVIATTGPEDNEVEQEITEARPRGTTVEGKLADGEWVQIFGYKAGEKVQSQDCNAVSGVTPP